MENDKTAQVAQTTEIPVSDLKNKPKTGVLPFVVTAAFLAIVIFGGYIYITSGSKPPNTDTLYSAASTAVNKGDYNQAQKLLREALALNKDDPKTLSAMIQAIALKGNQTGQEKQALDEATPYINQVIQNRMGNADTLISIGYAYETAGEYSKAQTYYEGATKLAPKSANAWFHLGHVQQFLGKNDEANKDYDKAYSIDPKQPLVLQVKANKLFSEGKLQEAFETFKIASEQPNLSDSLKAEALTGASISRGLQDNFIHISEALALSKQALDADPNFSPALATYGYNLSMTGKLDVGMEYIRKAITANPRISKNYYLLAMFYRAKKDFANSINYHKNAISKVGDDNTLLSNDDKNPAKAKYIYELAKTYSISGLGVDVFPLVKNSLELDQSLKKNLKNDFQQNGFFTELSNNNDFLAIVNSI